MPVYRQCCDSKRACLKGLYTYIDLGEDAVCLDGGAKRGDRGVPAWHVCVKFLALETRAMSTGNLESADSTHALTDENLL